jgi:triosephosphate isomerase (TIM)
MSYICASLVKFSLNNMRQQIVAGNWKMNTTIAEGLELARAVAGKVENPRGLVVFGTPATHLESVSAAIKGHPSFHTAGQNCHQEAKGAYTGEISADMLVSAGATYVILGHSERRQYFKEDNEMLAKKVDIALQKGLIPIFCCGEPLEIREEGTHVSYVASQLEASLYHLTEEQFSKIVIAYEPIWAIGTGKTASSDQAQEMHFEIRNMLAGKYGAPVADATPILYGGSCNASNAAELFGQPDVDGGLIGGASLKADDFVTIINALK